MFLSRRVSHLDSITIADDNPTISFLSLFFYSFIYFFIYFFIFFILADPQSHHLSSRRRIVTFFFFISLPFSQSLYTHFVSLFFSTTQLFHFNCQAWNRRSSDPLFFLIDSVSIISNRSFFFFLLRSINDSCTLGREEKFEKSPSRFARSEGTGIDDFSTKISIFFHGRGRCSDNHVSSKQHGTMAVRYTLEDRFFFNLRLRLAKKGNEHTLLLFLQSLNSIPDIKRSIEFKEASRYKYRVQAFLSLSATYEHRRLACFFLLFFANNLRSTIICEQFTFNNNLRTIAFSSPRKSKRKYIIIRTDGIGSLNCMLVSSRNLSRSCTWRKIRAW